MQKLKKIGVAKRGQVVLTTGLRSDFYIDLKIAYGDPELLQLMISEVLKRMDKNITCVAGLGHGGIPLATALALNKNLKLVLVRKEKRKHGSKKWIDGYCPIKSDRIVVVDDVLTTGSSIKEIIRKIEPTGAKIIKCIVIVNRSPNKKFKFKVEYLVKAEDLLDRAVV
ncbi:MAG: Orotate phosphoribosyltransferase [Candidatus Yanofskybacteria bacterium GW2011_GWA2_44_10]|nr:MAG: Orotate phosphoribosyltransferase [Candidatus Yanofskybacteria bacterium GW2011_GWA2_44_10]